MTIHEMLEVVQVALSKMDRVVKVGVSLGLAETATGDIFLLDEYKRLGVDPYATETVLGLLNEQGLTTEVYEEGKVLLY